MTKAMTERKYPVFSERLRLLRKAHGLTQERAAVLLNVERSTYAKYETGQSMPHQDTLLRLTDLFNVSVDYMLGKVEGGSTAGELREDGSLPGLSAEEAAVLTMARKLTKTQREAWLSIASEFISINAKTKTAKDG